MYGATAASLDLPFGSLVRLVNPKTGKSQIVRINDRGPYVAGRELDVSYEVARRLGIDSVGVSRLRMELIEVPRRRD
jgi:rare lipoprotein A